MPVNPADQEVRRTISSILSKFLSKNERNDDSFTMLRQQVDEKYEPIPVEVHGLSNLLRRSPELELREQHRFLFLEPVEKKKILPLLTLETSNQWVHFRAYVLLTMCNCSGTPVRAVRGSGDGCSTPASG